MTLIWAKRELIRNFAIAGARVLSCSAARESPLESMRQSTIILSTETSFRQSKAVRSSHRGGAAVYLNAGRVASSSAGGETMEVRTAKKKGMFKNMPFPIRSLRRCNNPCSNAPLILASTRPLPSQID